MKKSSIWILTAVALAVLLTAGARLVSQRQASQQAAALAASPTPEPSIELASTDVFTLQTQSLSLGVAVSGALKASQSAWIKARVAGELQSLSVREGDRVQAGQVIARIDPTEYQARVRQARQQADAAQAQVDIAQRQFDNNQALVNQGFISQTALLTSQASLSGAKATHAAAWAALDLANKSLSDATLRSPLSGVVSQRMAQPGERVAIEAKLVEVINLSKLEMEAALTPEDASRVRVGMVAQLQVEGQTEPVSAKVLRINPSAQMGSRSVLVYLGLSGREGLRQALFAQGSLGTQSLQVLAVPVSSLRTDKPQPYVQVVQDGRVQHATVQTGVRSQSERQSWVAITGLAEGAQVLAGSAGAVREGVRVKFTAPADPAGAAGAAGAAIPVNAQ
jgi:RND family efflux transporter MFP subunit